MGYDITFHPVSSVEVNEFIFDVIKHPETSRAKAERISPHEDIRKYITGLYEELIHRYQKKIDMQGLGYVIATILGFLHPYWYARGSCISFLVEKFPEYQRFLRNFSTLEPEIFQKLANTQLTAMTQNYSIGAYIPADKVSELRDQLERDRSKIFDQNDAEGHELWGSVIHALRYAEQNNMGILEATDVVIPMMSKNWSNPLNYRAVHLDNELVFKNAREIDVLSPNARRFTNENDA